jgi:hypothetical protein
MPSQLASRVHPYNKAKAQAIPRFFGLRPPYAYFPKFAYAVTWTVKLLELADNISAIIAGLFQASGRKSPISEKALLSR